LNNWIQQFKNTQRPDCPISRPRSPTQDRPRLAIYHVLHIYHLRRCIWRHSLLSLFVVLLVIVHGNGGKSSEETASQFKEYEESQVGQTPCDWLLMLMTESPWLQSNKHDNNDTSTKTTPLTKTKVIPPRGERVKYQWHLQHNDNHQQRQRCKQTTAATTA